MARNLSVQNVKCSNSASLDSKNSVMKLLYDEGGGDDNAQLMAIKTDLWWNTLR